MKAEKEYYAFISYKHEDKKWAKWLQNKLEHYRFPTNLNGRTDLPKRISPTFRDETDLTPGYLADEINKALYNSQWLIIICSPRSAKSQWVCMEAQTFINLGRTDHIIPFIIDGNPFSNNIATECYPEPLLNLTGNKEILAANINEMGRNAAVIKVIARMFGLRFDTLWQRHQREKKRNNIIILSLLIVILCIGFSIYSYVNLQKHIANKAQIEKSIQALYTDYFKCEKLYQEHKYAATFNEGKRIMNRDFSIPDTLSSMFEYLLRMSYAAMQSDTLSVTNRYSADFPEMDWGNMPVTFSNEGDTVYVGCSGFSILNSSTGKRINYSDFWPSDIRIAGDNIYTYDDYKISIYDKHSLKKIASHTLATEAEKYLMKVGTSANGKRFLTISENDTYYIYDSDSGHLINTFPQLASIASINYDGSIIAMSENEELKLYHVDTGEPLDKYNGLYASDLQFDQLGNWLLLYHKKYDSLRILNIETGEDYSINSLNGQWGNSFNFDGNTYANKYIVSDDNRYIAIGANIYDMTNGSLVKRLEKADKAMGLKIFPGAKKVIQVNVDREIMIYTRKTGPAFEKTNRNFYDLKKSDDLKNEEKYDIKESNGEITILKSDSKKKLGLIKNIDGMIYHVSVSPNEKYVLINSLAIPLSLYDLSTGTLVQEFPFRPGYDGDLGFGVFGNDGCLYINELHTTFKYSLIPLNVLLNTEVNE